MINAEEVMNVYTSIIHVKTSSKENAHTMTTASLDMPPVNQQDLPTKTPDNID